MAAEIEIITLSNRHVTLKTIIDAFNEINQQELKGYFVENYVRGAIENDQQVDLNEVIGQKSTFIEFIGGFSQPCLVWKNTTPFDDFYTAEETIVPEAKFDKRKALELSIKAQAINISYKLEWKFNEVDRIFGFTFLLCLCQVYDGILLNIESGFKYIGTYTLEQVRDFLRNEYQSEIN